MPLVGGSPSALLLVSLHLCFYLCPSPQDFPRWPQFDPWDSMDFLAAGRSACFPCTAPDWNSSLFLGQESHYCLTSWPTYSPRSWVNTRSPWMRKNLPADRIYLAELLRCIHFILGLKKKKTHIFIFAMSIKGIRTKMSAIILHTLLHLATFSISSTVLSVERKPDTQPCMKTIKTIFC